jgi:preprotein translocase subunit YajC
MLISEAFATTSQQTASPGGLTSFLPLIVIFAIFYFLLIRPQQKKVKEHDALVKNLQKGDSVVTAGGILGKISKVEDDVLFIEIAVNSTVQVLRSTVSNKIDKKLSFSSENKAAAKKAAKKK